MNSAQVLSIGQPRTSRRPQSIPYPDFPIERRIRSNTHDFQLPFAEEAATRAHQRFDDALLVPDRFGLLVLGRHEQALKAPTDVIRALYPWKLEVGMACVRYQDGDVTREPVMLVTVDVSRFHAQAVCEDLADRTTAPVSREFAYDRAVVSAKVRLANLLGYADSLENLTRGEAVANIWLSEWVPVSPPEGPASA
jgi:hypothetical protein